MDVKVFDIQTHCNDRTNPFHFACRQCDIV